MNGPRRSGSGAVLVHSKVDEKGRHSRALLDVVAMAGAVSHYRRTGQLTTEHLDELDDTLAELTAARRALLRLPPATDD